MAVCCVFSCKAQQVRELHTFFKTYAQLSEREIRSIVQGRAVAKILPSNDPNQIFVFGAVYIHADPEEYLELEMDVERLKSLPQYVGAKKLGEPPLLSDLDGFTLDADDVKSLQSCKIGDCDVQLPAEAIEDFRKRIDWSKNDVATQVNVQFQRIAFETLQRYRQGGNDALGAYHDQDEPSNISKYFRSLLDRSAALPSYLPELKRFLLDYPKAEAKNMEEMFYWERVKFGLKPTLRLNHAVAYRLDGPRLETRVLAIKQLYASHYFQVALDLNVCVRDTHVLAGTGFFLISLKGSRQVGLTGFKGSLLRRVVTNKTRSGQESALANIKRSLEMKRARVSK